MAEEQNIEKKDFSLPRGERSFPRNPLPLPNLRVGYLPFARPLCSEKADFFSARENL
jgi:hypothetical protein